MLRLFIFQNTLSEYLFLKVVIFHTFKTLFQSIFQTALSEIAQLRSPASGTGVSVSAADNICAKIGWTVWRRICNY
jgi:hypothetical protein